MYIDAALTSDLRGVPAAAKQLERLGYDGVLTAETKHDPFLPLLLAAEATTRVQLSTSLAIAFGRSPMTMANVAWDLNDYSCGRFVLGLGSQVKPHIERRFSMPWSHPAARMKEFIAALRAIWDCWQTGAKLDFRGDFYTHTLMTPMFDPGPSEYGPPDVLLAGVGEGMARVAGEVADGLLVHPLNTERYAREVLIPMVEEGLRASGRTRGEFDLKSPVFIVTAGTEPAFEMAARATCGQIAFYASTPAYRGVMELHGWGELQTELHLLSRQGRWSEMGALIDDDVLETIAIVAEPDEVGPQLLKRFGDLYDRVSLYAPYSLDPELLQRVISPIRSQ